MSNPLRAAVLVALALVVAVLWVVSRTVAQAQNSEQAIAHTQQTLVAIESVLSSLLDVDGVVRDGAGSPAGRTLDAIDTAGRAVEDDIARVTTLTADSPAQQERTHQLHAAATRMMTALRSQMAATQAGASGAAEAEAARLALDAARTTMRAMRTDENRFLAERVQANQAAGRQLQQVNFGLVVLTVGMVAATTGMVAKTLRQQRRDTQALRQARDELEQQVDARSTDLRESNERLRSIIDSAVDGIVVIDATGRVESFNRGAETLFGYAAAEVIGRNVNMLMPSPQHQEHDHYLAAYRDTGQARIIGIGREVNGRRKDGTAFPLHLSVGEMSIEGVQKFTGILHDLSARVRMEQQLREQTALARLGEMAAVIAHEVKNPLAGVRGAIQVIGSRLPKDSRDAGMIKEIVSRIDALNGLIQDLLLFARPPQPRPASVDVATLMQSTAELLAADPALKDVKVRLDGVAPVVMADPEQLKIVFVNLLVNAGHAMNGRGTIRVSLSAVDDRCRIAVADDGPGIPPDVREKIFTPFFTTKARGTGLGLSTARRFIEAHHGQIAIDCPPDGGTTVTIDLPGADPAEQMSP